MSDLPNTENAHVVAIAATLRLSEYPSNGSSGEEFFSKRLERFLTAFKAIELALNTPGGTEFDVKQVIDSVLVK